MISCIIDRNITAAEGLAALEIAKAVIKTANLDAAGIRVAEATPRRRAHVWALHLTTVTCSKPLELAFGPGFIAVRAPASTDVVDHVHLHVVVARVIEAWEDAGLCEDVRDTLGYTEQHDPIALLNRCLKSLGQPLTGWPFTPFILSQDGAF